MALRQEQCFDDLIFFSSSVSFESCFHIIVAKTMVEG